MLDVEYRQGQEAVTQALQSRPGRLTVKLSRVKRYPDAAALKVTTVPHDAMET
jgi:hypothetical protein